MELIYEYTHIPTGAELRLTMEEGRWRKGRYCYEFEYKQKPGYQFTTYKEHFSNVKYPYTIFKMWNQAVEALPYVLNNKQN